MINKLIEQIGGRGKLESIASLAAKHTYNPCKIHHDALVESCDSEVIEAMARALLAVLDAKPVGVTISPTLAAMDEVSQVGIDVYLSPPAASVPEGYKLVPVEPSKEMLLASKRYKAKNKVPTGPGVYRAMIAAAPAPGGKK